MTGQGQVRQPDGGVCLCLVLHVGMSLWPAQEKHEKPPLSCGSRRTADLLLSPRSDIWPQNKSCASSGEPTALGSGSRGEQQPRTVRSCQLGHVCRGGAGVVRLRTPQDCHGPSVVLGGRGRLPAQETGEGWRGVF